MRWFVFGLLPDAALPLLLAVAGLLLILGFRRAALGIVPFVLLTPIIAPVVESVLAELPPWASLLILAVVGLGLLQGVAALFLGPRAAAHMTGILAAHFVLACLLFPFRVVRWISRVVANETGANN